MKGYRRRFVLYNMLLIGFVLIVSFVALGIFLHRTQLNELEKTMSLVIEPWDEPFGRSERPVQPGGGAQRPVETDAPEADPAQTGEPRNDEHFPPEGERPKPPEGDRRSRKIAAEGVISVFYNAEDGGITVLSSRYTASEDEIASAVREIICLDGSFGKLPGRSLYYMREGVGPDYKIALADTAYISSRTVRSVVLLAAVFVGAMGLFFIISVLLSRLAAKPMENALAMERQFVQDLSHDLKTPVTVVLANNSILRSNRDATVGEQEQWIDSTENAAKNMMELVNQMLTLSALDDSAERGAKPGAALALEPTDLSEAAEKCVLQMESVAYDRGVELTNEIEEGIIIRSDAQSCEKLMSGLIENALKYEPGGGRVAIALERAPRKGKKVRFTVKNYGSVISEEDLPHIFERFYRGDKARSEKGHGLGLPILKRTAELIGAGITVTSSREGGTVFTVEFEGKE